MTWLFCGGMMRSGSTLQYQIAAHVVEEYGIGQGVGWASPEALGKAIQANNGSGGWQVLKTHVPTNEVQQQIKHNGARALYIYRDLRDVAVSMMKKHGIGFNSIIQGNVLRDAVAWYESWVSLGDAVMVSKYETVFADMPQETARIMRKVGLQPTDKQAAIAASQFEIRLQQRRIGLIADGEQYDKTHLLHRGHISSSQGAPGQWKTVLTRPEIQYIQTHHGGWLRNRGYRLKKI